MKVYDKEDLQDSIEEIKLLQNMKKYLNRNKVIAIQDKLNLTLLIADINTIEQFYRQDTELKKILKDGEDKIKQLNNIIKRLNKLENKVSYARPINSKVQREIWWLDDQAFYRVIETIDICIAAIQEIERCIRVRRRLNLQEC